jgi:hypothetical protein
MAVSGMTRHRWRTRIRGSSSMNRRLVASCCDQRAGEKKERGILLIPAKTIDHTRSGITVGPATGTPLSLSSKGYWRIFV